jgi:Xaa-Pro aminopeptidase
MFNLSELRGRRRQLLAEVNNDAIIILISAAECLRNGDVFYPYRQNSDFLYLTAFPEPDAVALLLPNANEKKFILFNRAYDPVAATWRGEVIGQERACKEYAADEAYPIEQLETVLPDYLTMSSQYYHLGAKNHALFKRINAILAGMSRSFSQEQALNPAYILHEMRLKKSPSELTCLKKAAAISAKAHVRAMQACRPYRYEYHLEAELTYEFYQHAAFTTAYPSIVASGNNACILHYTKNSSLLKPEDLVLIDAGCEYQSYASDITRCFPVSGTFSPAQKAVYEIVLNVQQGLIGLIKPGVVWETLQTYCIKNLTEGLLELGLLKGNLASLIEQKAYKKFYMHSCSHWLGLDVHDVGHYLKNGKSRPLEPNMVFTVEPGIYIPSQTSAVDEKWWGIGIRIEDDVCVTGEGCEVFSQAAPKQVNDIESLMGV